MQSYFDCIHYIPPSSLSFKNYLNIIPFNKFFNLYFKIHYFGNEEVDLYCNGEVEYFPVEKWVEGVKTFYEYYSFNDYSPSNLNGKVGLLFDEY